MRSCERPLKRSARDALPSSVSKLYSLSIRTQGSSCRRCASSSLRRVTAFSCSRNASRSASHSSRVPIFWLFIASSSLCLQQVAVARATDYVGHRRRESNADVHPVHLPHRDDLGCGGEPEGRRRRDYRRGCRNARPRDCDSLAQSHGGFLPSFLDELLQTVERFVPSLRDVLEIGSCRFHLFQLELPDALAATPYIRDQTSRGKHVQVLGDGLTRDGRSGGQPGDRERAIGA